MKKVLSTVAALGLVAGLASTAAAVEFSMSGDYTVEGVYMSAAEGAGVILSDADSASPAGRIDSSDAYYMHTFRILPVMKVNDKITMRAEIRLADDSIWGSQGDISATDSAAKRGQDFYVHRLYMDYASPIGKFRIGRVPSGSYGTTFLDTDVRANKIVFSPDFLASGAWSTEFHIIKAIDGDATANTASAQDSDAYEARLFYKDTAIDAGLRYAYTNNLNTANTTDNKQSAILYGKYKLDNYFANAELVHNFGDREVDGTPAVDYDSYAAMLQAGGKFDALTASLMYFYLQGQDPNSNDLEAAQATLAGVGSGTGSEFEPLYILTGRHTGLLNNDIRNNTTANDDYTDTMSAAGVHAIVAAVDYAVSKELTLHGAIGWAKADEEEITLAANQDDDYGWEYNVGAAYKLLDNLTYEAHFGYLDTGDFFQYGNTATDTENVYLLTHSLTMTF